MRHNSRSRSCLRGACPAGVQGDATSMIQFKAKSFRETLNIRGALEPKADSGLTLSPPALPRLNACRLRSLKLAREFIGAP